LCSVPTIRKNESLGCTPRKRDGSYINKKKPAAKTRKISKEPASCQDGNFLDAKEARIDAKSWEPIASCHKGKNNVESSRGRYKLNGPRG